MKSEYMVLHLGLTYEAYQKDSSQRLTALGKKGWHVHSFVATSNNLVFTLERAADENLDED